MSRPASPHTYTLAVDPLQTISVLVMPTGSTLQPSVQLLSPTGVTIGTATAAAAGQDALIQATATTGTTTGTYQIVVGGAGSTLGNYTVQVTLNAALDAAAYLAGQQQHACHGPGHGRIVPKPELVGQRDAGGRARFQRGQRTPLEQLLLRQPQCRRRYHGGAGNLSGSGTAISLLSPAGVTLASGATGPTNLCQAISGFSIPATGTYYLLVTGEAAATL